MRRKDREVTDNAKIAKIVSSCGCCRLGLVDDFGAYIVPLNFAFLQKDGERIFYFHSAKEGKKIALIQKQSKATFELDSKHQLLVGKSSCKYGYGFQCVMGRGDVSLVDDIAEKKRALNLLMKHYDEAGEHTFSDEQANSVAVIKLIVTEWTCKERL